MANTLRVRVCDKHQPRVGIWEIDPAHPDGEVFVAGEKTFTVGDTPAVRAAIREERIEEVSGRHSDDAPRLAPADTGSVQIAQPEEASGGRGRRGG
jgi:hypothetical protein